LSSKPACTTYHDPVSTKEKKGRERGREEKREGVRKEGRKERKEKKEARSQWLTSVILATQEAEIRRVKV
jgi:hypothetical protein